MSTFLPASLADIRGIDYAKKAFGRARRALMAPHPNGETDAFFDALDYCDDGLHGLGEVPCDVMQRHIRFVKKMLDHESRGEADWHETAKRMSQEKRALFSDAIDELASYFSEV